MTNLIITAPHAADVVQCYQEQVAILEARNAIQRQRIDDLTRDLEARRALNDELRAENLALISKLARQVRGEEGTMKAKPQDFAFTAERITEAVDTWTNFTGFAGETCAKCAVTANVMNGPGWFCVCGHYNEQATSGGPMTHKTPDLGPTRATIKAGIEASQTWRDYVPE